jgi:hydrogenase maturation protease
MSDPSHAPPGAVLVIGYGSMLRGDDAAGPRAASAVAGLGLPGVIAKAVTQLTPELAEPLASARLAIFIDACLVAHGGEVEVRPIEPADPGAASGHVGDPGRLLALARIAYGACPRSWLVTIPASDVTLGRGLSPLAGRGVEEAVRRVASLAVGHHLARGQGS